MKTSLAIEPFWTCFKCGEQIEATFLIENKDVSDGKLTSHKNFIVKCSKCKTKHEIDLGIYVEVVDEK